MEKLVNFLKGMERTNLFFIALLIALVLGLVIPITVLILFKYF